MAPNLAHSQHALVHDMITSRSLTASQMGDVAGCSERSIKYIRANVRLFGSTTAPPNRGGRPPTITPPMLAALREHLLEKPNEDLDDMAIYLWDEFSKLVSRWAIRRALSSIGWSPKQMQRIARGRNADLRDYYVHKLSEYRSFQLVYVDESGCDKRIGFRRRGWSPRGVTPVMVAQFQRGQRYQILPAYSQDGIVCARVFQGSTDANIFLDFIEQMLSHCNPFPGKRSVVIMDNASIHHSKEIEAACARAGVKLVYLPPYSPDLNPIEEFFAELKAFIKKHWKIFEDNSVLEFESFLEWCVDEVGGRKASAQGHFRHAGLVIEEELTI